MHPKDADGMANSVDPDQTASSEAVWSWSALFAETYLSQYIEFVQYFWQKILLANNVCPDQMPHYDWSLTAQFAYDPFMGFKVRMG